MTCFVNWWRKHWKGMDLELFNNIVINHNNTYKLLNCQCFVRSQLPVFCEISTASVLWDLNCQCFVRSQLPVFCEISTVSVLWDLNCQCFVRSQLPMFCESSTASVLWDLHSIQVGNVQKCIGKKIWIMVYLPVWSFCDYIMLHRCN